MCAVQFSYLLVEQTGDIEMRSSEKQPGELARVSLLRAWFLLFFVLFSFGFEPATGQDQDKKASVDEVTEEEIDTAAKEAEASDLGEDKAKIKERYTKARAELKEAAKAKAKLAQYRSLISSASDDIAQARRDKERVDSSVYVAELESADLQKLDSLYRELARKLKTTQEDLGKRTNEPRLKRKDEITEEISKAEAALKSIDGEFEALKDSGDAPLVLKSRRILLVSRRMNAKANLDQLKSERESYVAQGELPRLMIDLRSTEVQQLDKDLKQLSDLREKRRAEDAIFQRLAAEEAYRNAPASLKQYAQRSIDLANRRLEIASEISQANDELEIITAKLNYWKKEHARTIKHAESETQISIGPILLERRSKLPSSADFNAERAKARGNIRSSRDELYRLEDRRAKLTDVKLAADVTLNEWSDSSDSISERTRRALADLYRLEVKLLDSLLTDATQRYNAIQNANTTRQDLAKELESYRSFIDTRVFWARSAPPFTAKEFGIAAEAFSWVFNQNTIDDVVASLRMERGRRYVEPIVFYLLLGFLFFGRYWFRGRIFAQGELVQQNNQTIAPTFKAFAYTVLLSLPLPLMPLFLAGGLINSYQEPVQAIASGLVQTSTWLLLVDSVRHVVRPGGLAEKHFRWSPRVSSYRALWLFRLLLIFGTPFVFLSAVYQGHGDPRFLGSLGRICSVVIYVLLALIGFRFFCGAREDGNGGAGHRWLERPRKFWMFLAVVAPVVLALTSLLGYQYTALRLTNDILLTLAVAFWLSVIGSILSRWLRIARRLYRQKQLARQQAVVEGSSSEAADFEAMVADEQAVDLDAMDLQVRRLIFVAMCCLGIVTISMIWFEFVIAMAPILEWKLWSVEGAGGVTHSITILNLLLAALIAIFGMMTFRNIPGLIDAILLGRLGIEASMRYAVTTLLQYSIVICSVLGTCAMVGLSWDKVQWLVAAFSVGLGFGLQEVIANFVCGILVLFERPIRIGDTVTLGTTTGVVVRIRSRATTIRNWDRQEVIIPNKELITGRITNWSLSDAMTRVVIEVGVSHHSDTDRTQELLYQVAAENPNVLDDPSPIITFELFGESSLKFIVRVYLAEISLRLSTTHELHTAIKKRLAEEGIEIAIQKLDVQIRPTSEIEALAEPREGI